MPIIDNELVGDGTDGEFDCPTTACGLLIENSIKKNIEARGDRTWMVGLDRAVTPFLYISVAVNEESRYDGADSWCVGAGHCASMQARSAHCVPLTHY